MTQDSTDKLAPMEFALMDAVRVCKENAFGATIWKEIQERTQRDYSSGAVYTGLNRLVKQHLVDKVKEADGKYHYYVTEKGKRALVSSRESYQRLIDKTADIPSSWGYS